MEKSRFFSPFSALPLVWKRVITLGLMYAGQGLPAGLAFNAYATILRESGVSLHTIGWSGLTFLPWALPGNAGVTGRLFCKCRSSPF